MISAVIPYHSNRDGLVATLIGLQSQVVPPDLIVLIDTSKDKSGLTVARRYSTHDVPIVVENATCTIYEAWNKGIELSGGGADVLFLNDDLLFPQNLIDILLGVTERVPALAIAPLTPPREHSAKVVTEDFAWYSDVDARLSLGTWLPGFCFLLRAECIQEVGLFDERFKVWYGDTDYQRRIEEYVEDTSLVGIARMDSLFVYHYGGSSYNYKDKKIKGQIAKDLSHYEKKYAKH